MNSIFRFPNGYDVKVLRKQDVLDCIDDNIIDKEVALELVKRCEIDAANFLKEGRWASIPFIGNIRIPKTKQLMMSEQYKEIDEAAKATLDRDKYVLFRRDLASEIGRIAKQERFYKYAVSKMVSKNAKLFRQLCISCGDAFARYYMFSVRSLTPLNQNNITDYVKKSYDR